MLVAKSTVGFESRAWVETSPKMLLRTKPRLCPWASSRIEYGEPVAASRVFDELSDKKRRTALDSAPGLQKAWRLLTEPMPL